jgi:hypothetical protein
MATSFGQYGISLLLQRGYLIMEKGFGQETQKDPNKKEKRRQEKKWAKRAMVPRPNNT